MSQNRIQNEAKDKDIATLKETLQRAVEKANNAEPAISTAQTGEATGLDDDPGNEAPAKPVSEQKIAQGFPTSVSADLLQPPKTATRIVSLSLVTLVIAVVAWARFAVVEEVTVGQGKVVPASKVQMVQNLEGGIVSRIAIKPGALVKKGQLLLQIDPTGFDAKLNEQREQIAGLKATMTRLTALMRGKKLVFEKDFAAAHPKLVLQNHQLYKARNREITAALDAFAQKAKQKHQEIAEVTARIKNLKRAHSLAAKELQLTAQLAKDEIVSKADWLAAQAKENDLAGQLEAAELSLPRLTAGLKEIENLANEKKNNYRADALARLNEAQIKFAALSRSIAGDADRVRRTEVRSPVDGVVKELHTTTIGQVVKPGADLVEIVPQNDSLLIETRIRPQDIAFLARGQDAVVKLTAYDYALYGSLKGKLVRIGADSIVDKKGNAWYVVDVRTNENFLQRKNQRLPIIPGMVARVDILTGKKTIFNYMTKPLHRMANEALRER